MQKAFFVLLLLLSLPNKAQHKKSALIPHEIGFLYNYATEDNFWFNDSDYTYTANVFKFQALYELKSWTSSSLELVISPQIHHIRHQLLNEQFVTPDQANFEDKRIEFTQVKTLTLLGLEFGISYKLKLIRRLYGLVTAGVGVARIDKRTERLASGFTFIENGSIGLLCDLSSKVRLSSALQIGHVSNFDLQSPNSGYNTLGLEFGIRYRLAK